MMKSTKETLIFYESLKASLKEGINFALRKTPSLNDSKSRVKISRTLYAYFIFCLGFLSEETSFETLLIEKINYFNPPKVFIPFRREIIFFCRTLFLGFISSTEEPIRTFDRFSLNIKGKLPTDQKESEVLEKLFSAYAFEDELSRELFPEFTNHYIADSIYEFLESERDFIENGETIVECFSRFNGRQTSSRNKWCSLFLEEKVLGSLGSFFLLQTIKFKTSLLVAHPPPLFLIMEETAKILSCTERFIFIIPDWRSRSQIAEDVTNERFKFVTDSSRTGLKTANEQLQNFTRLHRNGRPKRFAGGYRKPFLAYELISRDPQGRPKENSPWVLSVSSFLFSGFNGEEIDAPWPVLIITSEKKIFESFPSFIGS